MKKEIPSNLQWRPIEERIGSSTDPSQVYFWGARHRDDLARCDRDTDADGTQDESLWCLMDYFDPVAVVDDEGEVVERYAFSAFGVAIFLAPDYSPRSSSAVAWDFLFHGQFENAETGWQNYGFRYYVPELGRWLNRDPIRERGGRNLYSVTANRTINRNDLLGLYDPDDPGRRNPAGEYPKSKLGEENQRRIAESENAECYKDRHYNRNRHNNPPETEEDAINEGWRKLDDDQSVYHRHGEGWAVKKM